MDYGANESSALRMWANVERANADDLCVGCSREWWLGFYYSMMYGLVCGRKPKHCTASWSWGKGRSLLTDLVCRISEKERGCGLLEPLTLLFGCKRKPCVLHSFCCEQLLDPAMWGTPSSSSTNTDGPYTQVNEFPFISALFIVWEWEIIFFGI